MATSSRRRWRSGLLIAGLVAIAVCTVVFFLTRSDPGDLRLRPFVYARPPVPVVFTSRTQPASLLAAPPEGEVFTYPGQPLWQAGEGRLRLLTPEGTVHELTWGKTLADGTTLIDVMSPSVSPDGTRIVFAGRKGGEDPGHFRLFEIEIDGSGLRQLTGGPGDPGAVAVPPMRFQADGRSILADEVRRAIDYDDVDPIILPDNRVVFASTRIPDLGRDHARRACQIWTISPDGGERRPITANRNTDRWPFQLCDGNVIFSVWSRNREVVSEGGDAIVPFQRGMRTSTLPTNNWMSLAFDSVTMRFTMRPSVPVWRPRPLFNGRLVFMTVLPEREAANAGSLLGTPGLAGLGTWLASGRLFDTVTRREEPFWELTGEELLRRLRVVQLSPNYASLAPSSLSAESHLPRQDLPAMRVGPLRDALGHPVALATPSPCPGNLILLSAAVLEGGPGLAERFGIYLAGDNWSEWTDAGHVGLTKLFDDPELVDAEPVAVYPRKVTYRSWNDLPPIEYPLPASIDLAGGQTAPGPFGHVNNVDIYNPINLRLAGQRTDAGESPLFTPPPRGFVKEILFYAAHRDRFDDRVIPRVKGEWELLRRAPVEDGSFNVLLPGGPPTMLVGVGEDGRVVKWRSPAQDSSARRATFYAFAGDHYSGLRVDRFNTCIGCHSGHSGIFRDSVPELLAR